MNIRTAGLTIAALSALAPAVAGAWPGKSSLDACVNAFEKTLAPAGESARAFKVVYQGDRFSSSVAQYFPSEYTFELQANDPKTGEVIARVRCLANTHGAVASMQPLPAHAAPVEARSVRTSATQVARN
ncbi:MAG TPA: hypothetical protein VME42_00480 [Steroidobacteraceae bacterium]|nr:hypothetical protein [Steroidobacteraceae bacterium]